MNAALSVTLYINCTGEPVIDLIEAGVHSRELGVALLEEITDDGLLGEKAMDFCEPAAFAQKPMAIAANNILFNMLASKVSPV